VTSNLDSPTDVNPSKAKSDQLRPRQCSGDAHRSVDQTCGRNLGDWSRM